MSLKEAQGVWKNYLQNKKYRVNLADAIPGLDGLWVDMREFKSLTLAEASLLTTKPETEGDTSNLRNSLVKLVIDWNLTDMETGEQLVIPSKDINVLDKVSLEVLTVLMTKAGEREGVALPNEIKTSSGA
mgnify:FL=1